MTRCVAVSDPTCPVPLSRYSHVVMAHGGGGRLMQQLIESVFVPAFASPALETRHDSAVLATAGRPARLHDRLATSCSPLFFPGGDIGTLAVNGTVNDLAMSGARPLVLSAAFILEEGLPMETLGRVVASMRDGRGAAGVQIVTGDTKVVDKGKGDGLFVNTCGRGRRRARRCASRPRSVRPGDAVVLSGDLGRHGMAIMSVREGLAFESAIESDCAPLAEPVLALDRGPASRCIACAT